MASNQQQYVAQLQLLQERYPQEPKNKLLHLLRKSDGDVDQVSACLIQRENYIKKFDALEARYGTALTALQEQYPCSEPLKRARLLTIMERFDGDLDRVRKCLQRLEAKQNAGAVESTAAPSEQPAKLKAQQNAGAVESTAAQSQQPAKLKGKQNAGAVESTAAQSQQGEKLEAQQNADAVESTTAQSQEPAKLKVKLKAKQNAAVVESTAAQSQQPAKLKGKQNAGTIDSTAAQSEQPAKLKGKKNAGTVDSTATESQQSEKLKGKQNAGAVQSTAAQSQQPEELKAKYASQLAELATAGINVNCPCVLSKLEKHQGDANKIVETMKLHQLNTKYASQVAQLEADGVNIKNKRLLIQLLEEANGQVDVVKQLLVERVGKKNQAKVSANTTENRDDKASSSKNPHGISVDDLDNLKQLRQAGVHGNPVKILAVFHECNESVENTIARLDKEREEREQQLQKRVQQRALLAEIHGAYLTINDRDDWPRDIQQLYLDGSSMKSVVDSLRQLCLNRAGKKTERAIAQIAAAWNEQMHIPNVDLIFDCTRQLDQVESVRVSSAQPTYKTTDDMLIDIARRSGNEEKNRRTIVVTSDRALALHLKREGCQLVTSYMWFAHCVMVLTPDLINPEVATVMTPAAKKARYNFDELVRRIAKIEL